MPVSNQLLGRLFSATTLERVIAQPDSQIIRSLTAAYQTDEPLTNAELFKRAYDTLRRQYRNEYFYKNTILNKILFGRHSPNTTAALRELPVAGSILDFLMINGTGQVYEIKTELDNLERIDGQLSSYYQAFKYVNVVTHSAHVEPLRRRLQGTDVGLLELTEQVTLHVVKKPSEHSGELTHEAMFKILRRAEYEQILLKYFGRLPAVSQFQYYRTCLAWFSQLDLEVCHQALLRNLKQRVQQKQDAERLVRVPSFIRSLVYFNAYQSSDYRRLFRFLSSTVPER